jgi:hypothetical protein
MILNGKVGGMWRHVLRDQENYENVGTVGPTGSDSSGNLQNTVLISIPTIKKQINAK